MFNRRVDRRRDGASVVTPAASHCSRCSRKGAGIRAAKKCDGDNMRHGIAVRGPYVARARALC